MCYFLIFSHFITAFVSEYESEDQSPLLATVRAFLESFRLPGEAQKIERVFENFATIYYEHHIYHNKTTNSNDFPFDSSDGIFVMCFSIAMLNTDQHSPSVKV
jgi:brefeldin A-resistance guanine nucleotide exchange factor 1